MNSEQILLKLGNYLTDIDVEELRLNHALKGTNSQLILCLTIADIVKKYNATEGNRKAVLSLLGNLCSIHFSKQ